MTVAPPIEDIAKAIHREWSRITIRHLANHRPETEDEAHERRWALLPSATRAEFMRLAEAAWRQAAKTMPKPVKRFDPETIRIAPH